MKKSLLFTVLALLFMFSSCTNGATSSSEVSNTKFSTGLSTQISSKEQSDMETTTGASSGGVSSLSSVKKTSNNTKSTTSKATVSFTTSNTSNKQEPYADDKPSVANTAKIMRPIASTIDAQADTMRSRIMNSGDNVSVTGKKWYISNNGDNHNPGDSPDKAWASIEALSYYGAKIKPGDAVLFERGGVYRGTFSVKSGVYYGAYGSGDKPCIYGSKKNYAKEKWIKQSGNIWMVDASFSADVGIIVFNHGEKVGFKRKNMSDLKSDYDFFCENSKLYLYLSKDPAASFRSIEIGVHADIITIPKKTANVTIENLTLKYTGNHGIAAWNGVKNIVVRNCEIGWLGGSYLPGFKDGTVRAGNGVQFWQGCEDVTVENCWIYQIYDSALTHQGTGTYTVKNLTFRNCLLEYVGMGSIEYWHNEINNQLLENVIYSGNIMRFAGYGFGGEQRPDKMSSCHLNSNGNNPNRAVNFVITNNIFELSTASLISVKSGAGTLPVLSGNTYIQKKGARLGTYGFSEGKVFDDNVLNVIKNEWKDTTAKVMFG